MSGIDVLLADGTTARVRAIRPDDAAALVAFHAGLSPETVVLRFFGPHPRLSDAEVVRFTTVDGVDRVALVAERAGDVVGVARYDRPPTSDEAEVAFVVADAFQGRGVGTILLEHLAERGPEPRHPPLRGRHAVGELPHAPRVPRRRIRRQFTRTAEVMRVVLDIQPSPEARQAAEERDRRAVVRSMDRVLRPRSVVVVGVTADEDDTAAQVVEHLVAGGFHGAVHAVGTGRATVAGVDVVPSVEDVPGPVDLAVVASPAHHVHAQVEACGRRGAGAVVVMAGGFAETGGPGAARQDEMVRAAHGAGMRVVGPNCTGILNTDAAVSMNASTTATLPRGGPVGFASQSGGVGSALLAEAARRGLGLSSFVSLGNKADVSGNDALLWWEQDPATEVVLLHLESFGNPRRFARIARRLSRAKPVVTVKSGRSAAGARGAARHSAALPRPEQAVEALFHHTGVIRVETLEELFDTAAVLARQPLPRGRRVGIVADAGGAGVVAADACVGHGLVVPELRAATQRTLGSSLTHGAGTANPVDLLDGARPDEFGRAVAVLADADEVDAVLVIVTAAQASATAVTAAVASALEPGTRSAGPERAVTVVAATLGSGGDAGAGGAGEPVGEPVVEARRVPCFAYPETAARALAHVADYAAWRAQPDEPPPPLDGVDPNAARRHIADAATPGAPDVWITGDAAGRVVGAYGICCAATSDRGGTPPWTPLVAGFVQDPAFGPVVVLGPGDSTGPPAAGTSCLAPLSRPTPAGSSTVPPPSAAPGAGATALAARCGAGATRPWRTCCCAWGAWPRTCPRWPRCGAGPCVCPPRGPRCSTPRCG